MNATLTLNFEQLRLVLRALETLADKTANLEIEAKARALYDDVLLQALDVSP